MQSFPYITDYVNRLFSLEKTQWDFIILRPLLLVSYFFLRSVSFPLKFVFHRVPYGFEAYLIDKSMALGMKYLARYEAAELLLRHVQIEPLLYKHILSLPGRQPPESPRKLNGIYGDFGVEDLATVVNNSMTIGHDLLSYEVIDRFDKQAFLENIDYIRSLKPEDHEQLSKAALEENRRSSFQLLGATNIVMLIVTTITIFGDLRTTIKALNSFTSDSVLLWALKQIT